MEPVCTGSFRTNLLGPYICIACLLLKRQSMHHPLYRRHLRPERRQLCRRRRQRLSADLWQGQLRQAAIVWQQWWSVVVSGDKWVWHSVKSCSTSFTSLLRNSLSSHFSSMLLIRFGHPAGLGSYLATVRLSFTDAFSRFKAKFEFTANEKITLKHERLIELKYHIGVKKQ